MPYLEKKISGGFRILVSIGCYFTIIRSDLVAKQHDLN